VTVWAVLVAAGSGDRFGGPKQYELLGGRRVLDWSLGLARAACDGVVLVVEAGSGNKFLQNDAGLAVKMNSHLALKVGLQTRHHSEVAPGFKKTDELFTTNLVYNF